MPSDDWSEFPFLIAGDHGKAICFLHGFLGSKEDWMPVVRNLSPDYFCLSFDLPGHGESTTGVALPSYEELPGLLDRQRERLGVDQWIVAGYSLGGRVALNYALQYPDSVSSLVMISASPGIEGDEPRTARVASDRTWAERLSNTEPSDFLQQWYGQGVFSSLAKQEPVLEAMVSRRSRFSPVHMAQVLEHWGQGNVPDRWDGLKGLSFQVLAVAGADDETYCEHVKRMADIAHGVKVVIIENAGHTVHLEQPRSLADELRRFIEEQVDYE